MQQVTATSTLHIWCFSTKHVAALNTMHCSQSPTFRLFCCEQRERHSRVPVLHAVCCPACRTGQLCACRTAVCLQELTHMKQATMPWWKGATQNCIQRGCVMATGMRLM